MFHRLSLLFAGLGVFFFLGGLTVLVWAVAWPVSKERLLPAPAPSVTSARHSPVVTSSSLDLDELSELAYDKRLHRALYQVIPKQSDRSLVDRGTLPAAIGIVAILIEPGRAAALLKAPDGRVRLCRIGEGLGEGPQRAEVLEVQPTYVIVRYQQERVTLKLSRSDEL